MKQDPNEKTCFASLCHTLAELSNYPAVRFVSLLTHMETALSKQASHYFVLVFILHTYNTHTHYIHTICSFLFYSKMCTFVSLFASTCCICCLHGSRRQPAGVPASVGTPTSHWNVWDCLPQRHIRRQINCHRIIRFWPEKKGRRTQSTQDCDTGKDAVYLLPLLQFLLKIIFFFKFVTFFFYN